MPTDAELDAFILTRLKIIGIDITVLPADDPNAPADQRRILASARGMLKNTVPTVSNYTIDVQDFPPVLYPAALAAILDR